MIPLWMWIRVEEPGRRRTAFPVPLFLAWLLLAALLLLLLPFVLLAALLSWPWGWGGPLLKMYGQLFVLIGSLSGLRIDVESREGGRVTRLVMK
ncbi:MAG TPA: hypothetical protein PK919_08450 [Candidatus Aminicenantes bacterium]|nr:hypothetical protein [Candidatus Aminicenantes bacterium]